MTLADERVRRVLPSEFGTLLGALAFMASLTPSLIPRTALLQGVVAGIAFIISYGFGAGADFLWRWLGLPVLGGRLRSWVRFVPILLSLPIIAFGLAMATSWQNAIHLAMGMPVVESARPFTIALVALAVALCIYLLGHAFRGIMIYVASRLSRILPRRIATLSGFLVAATFFWSVGNGILLRGVLHVLDSSYRQIDLLLPADFAAPTEPEKTGSPNSLIEWSSLGARGRTRILAAPTQTEIENVTGAAAKVPIRVYVGINSASTVRDRASLALAELIRVGAFDRSLLVIATPTGTGWVDPAAMAPVEILHRGDIASVSVQYSYLPSWLSLLVEPDYGEETARTVFSVVYGYWRNLPRDKRPRLFLFGLSLGALNSDLSADIFDIVGDPYDGALWVGPPFASHTWRQVTDTRNQESPSWLPIFRDSSLYRFQNQTDAPVAPHANWGPIRIVYLQYASDPIVFFETASLWRRPSWMSKPRGPDVAPTLRWVPVVTFLQLLCDMMIATTTPTGVGHVYAADHYLSAWIAITEPHGWSDSNLIDLRKWLSDRQL